MREEESRRVMVAGRAMGEDRRERFFVVRERRVRAIANRPSRAFSATRVSETRTRDRSRIFRVAPRILTLLC